MSGANVKKNVRMAISALGAAAAVLLQCSFFPHVRLFGAIPEIALCVIVCVGCYEDERFVCILAVAAGFLLDTAGSDMLTLSPLLFLAAASVSILTSKKIFGAGFLSCAVSGAVSLSFGALRTWVILGVRGAPWPASLTGTVLPQLLYGVIVFFPVFLITKLHYKIFSVKDEKKFGRD